VPGAVSRENFVPQVCSRNSFRILLKIALWSGQPERR